MSLGRAVRRVGGGLHVRLYRLLGGRAVGRIGKAPVLLLTTEGRKTGRPRTAPLLYIETGDRLVVVASNGGAPTHPAWYLNLKANPRATAEVRRDIRPVLSRDATAEERARYWPELVRMYRWYDSYQAKTSREIPLVVLEPRREES
jgi:deazaflavin-dependent oxidoreductase (nitroreductase family)